ncbi:MAG: hypothetical protein AABM67_10155 [Acidobacteriota bacterium]
MRRFTSPLDKVSVAAPCPADWEAMVGGDRVRFCGQCELNVYNLTAMTRDEAESLITRTEGRLCLRFYRRKDGSIITEDCPVGLRALKRHARRIKQAVAASVLAFLTGIGANGAANKIGALLSNSPKPWGSAGRTLGVMAMPPDQKPEVVGKDHLQPLRDKRQRVPSKPSPKS